MIKRSLIKLIGVVISFVLCSLVIIKGISSSLEVWAFLYLSALTLAVTMFLIYKKPCIKRKVRIYEAFTMFLFIISLLILAILIYFYIDSSFANMISYNYTSTAIVSVVFYLSFLILNFFICIDDFKNCTNLINDVLIFITIGLTILEFAVFALYGGVDTVKMLFEDNNTNSIYIVQNYIYFAIMFAFIFLHKILNRAV